MKTPLAVVSSDKDSVAAIHNGSLHLGERQGPARRREPPRRSATDRAPRPALGGHRGHATPPPCFADTSGKRDISHNDPSPKSSPSESHPVAHLYHSKPPDGGSQIPKAKSHIPSGRRQRHERLRIEGEGQARCKTGNATIPGHSIEPSSSPPPLARPPKVTFYVQRPKTRLEPSRVVLYPFAQHSVRHGDPLEHHGGRYDAPPLASRHRLQILGT